MRFFKVSGSAGGAALETGVPQDCFPFWDTCPMFVSDSALDELLVTFLPVKKINEDIGSYLEEQCILTDHKN